MFQNSINRTGASMIFPKLPVADISFCYYALCLCHPRVSVKALFLGFLFVHPSVRSSSHILLPRYLMSGLNNVDKNEKEYSIAPADDLIGFLRSKVKVKAGREHHISWNTWAISKKLTGKSQQPLLMTWLDFRGQRWRSLTAGLSIW